MSSSETLPLAVDKSSRTYYVHDTHRFYSSRRREQLRLRCFIYTVITAIFTMALIVTVSYSVSQDTIDNGTNQTTLSGTQGNLTSSLRLGFAPGTGSFTLFSNVQSPNSFFIGSKTINSSLSELTDEEIRKGLQAGQLAIGKRLSSDVIALASPLPSPSPESRHRYAMSTCFSVGTLALAAVAELGATEAIEKSRASLGQPSAMGNPFDGGWVPQGVCKEFSVFNCTASKYRTFDGTCNRAMHWGSSMTPFRRLLPPDYADGIQEPRRAMSGKELPPARELSLLVHKPSPSSNPAFTVMLAVYGQFLDHDITATAISQGINGSSISCCPPAYDHPECFPVRVATGDPVFDVAGRTCMDFVRSAPAPQCKLGPRQQLNQVTAFIDASAVYGSDVGRARDLREFVGGRLRMQLTPDNRTLLPPSTNPNDGCNQETERLRGRYCFAAGDARANENLHLTTMHLLWARQHNRVADELSKVNPTWNDETLYQEARRVVAAQLQHITYQEFIPNVLGERETALRGLRPLKVGYRKWMGNSDDPTTDPSIANSFAAAAFRFAHTLLPGLMRITDAQKGSSSYMELHRMLFNPYSLYSAGGVESSVTSATSNVIQMTSTHVTSQLTSHLFEDPIGNTTVPCGLDLVSLNIQRGRDHGLPGYTRWREYCGLGKPESFADLEGHLDPQVLQEISVLYESVHDVDLYSGALAEIPNPGGIVGPTFTCLIADQFARLQKGDRFWYEVPNQPHSFTESQLQELRKTSLARIICDCSDGVTQVQAEAMKSVGPTNPMMSCEDIPQVNFESWKEAAFEEPPMLGASVTPFDWPSLKNNINETIREIVMYINSTTASVTPETTDWLAFKNYINDSFSDLRNQLNGLHPPKPVESFEPVEKMSLNQDSFILRATAPPDVAQDWINFKINLIKSLNDSVGTIGPSPTDVAKWMAFKQSVIHQFADLKNQVNAMNAALASELRLEKYKQEQIDKNNLMSQMQSANEIAVPMAAAFDWKNFRDDIIQSLDDAILNIGDNMPAPGDPAWTTFGSDIKDRFLAFRDKIDAERSTSPAELKKQPNYADFLVYKANIDRAVNETIQSIHDDMPPQGDPALATFGSEIERRFVELRDKINALRLTPRPKELATGIIGPGTDWLPYQTIVMQAIDDTVQNVRNNMPLPGDPAWAIFGPNIMKKVSMIETTTRTTDTMPSEPVKTQPRIFKTAASGNMSSNGMVNFTADWMEFRSNINNSLTHIIRDINSSKPVTLDPVGWTAFKNGVMDDFANFKNEIADIKSEWADRISNTAVTKPTLRAAFTGYNKYNPFATPITMSDWIAFKQQINDTLMNLVNEAKNTQKIDITGIHDAFNKSFMDLRNEIASLRDVILKNVSTFEETTTTMSSADVWKDQAAKWVNFRTQLNSTVQDLFDSLQNESKTTIGEVMKILFQARDKVAGLDPPAFYPTGAQPMDWIIFISSINKTIADSIRNVNNFKSATLKVNAAAPVISSAEQFTLSANLLILPCLFAISSTHSSRLVTTG